MIVIELGSKVRDTVTGFEGITTGFTVWLTGCVQYVVTPNGLDKDGKRREPEWFDDGRLQVTAPPDESLRGMSARATAMFVSGALQAGQQQPATGGPQDVPAHRVGG